MKLKKAVPYHDERIRTLPGKDDYFNGLHINRELSNPNPYSREQFPQQPYYMILKSGEEKESLWINERDSVQPEPHIPSALANEEKEAEFINEDKYRKRMKIRDLDNRVFDGSVHLPLRDRLDYKISNQLRKISKSI